MARRTRLNNADLEREWSSLSKDWYSIYHQWTPTSRAGYTEWIAQQIIQDFGNIHLEVAGLRQRSFCVSNHRGQADLETGIEQLTEKRLLRAMFNLSSIPSLGKARDYEIPLAKNQGARHGDIDLLCISSSSVFCVEAKGHVSSESILKAVLQAFTYTSLVATLRDRFLQDYDLPQSSPLIPAVLTFSAALSGRQLRTFSEWPNLVCLIRKFNANLRENRVERIRFFVIENDPAQLNKCLETRQEPNGDTRVVFSSDFNLIVTEYAKELFQ